MTDGWYDEVGAESPLMQGDIIVACPVLRWKDDVSVSAGSKIEEVLEASVEAVAADVVVMTQACDLEQRRVQNVLLCPATEMSKYKDRWEARFKEDKGRSPGKNDWPSFFTRVKDGFKWNLAVVNSGRGSTLATEHRIVDFHDVYTVPRSFVETILRERKSPRLRLRPPYREHLSQAFARYFMRVGLPTPVAQP
jgi:hypothetical protein